MFPPRADRWRRRSFAPGTNACSFLGYKETARHSWALIHRVSGAGGRRTDTTDYQHEVRKLLLQQERVLLGGHLLPGRILLLRQLRLQEVVLQVQLAQQIEGPGDRHISPMYQIDGPCGRHISPMYQIAGPDGSCPRPPTYSGQPGGSYPRPPTYSGQPGGSCPSQSTRAGSFARPLAVN
ncbi:uncharacterized protein LOC122378772 [Amphibalanus amphitrite]|uniref:uncharacterized protein LOC122378772 n=1 Tax=Amphibalanus amphitrite TaxID=1232801 RepID=UPI001C8FEFF7|nr:uncharacterized protein LOC122378772 [Amphibalanus amphitrite]